MIRFLRSALDALVRALGGSTTVRGGERRQERMAQVTLYGSRGREVLGCPVDAPVDGSR